MSEGLKRTPFYDIHVELKAKMVPFAGYEMPVQYPTGITKEHEIVRTAVGVFDVSHMGEFEVSGPDRNAFVNRVTCNDVSALEPGQAQYSALLTDEGTWQQFESYVRAHSDVDFSHGICPDCAKTWSAAARP